MAVRTRVLGMTSGTACGTPVAIHTPPAGRTAIAKEVCVYNNTADVRTCSVWVRRGGVDHYLGTRAATPAFDVFRLTGDFALEVGDTLYGYVNGATGTYRCYAGGALLEGVPT